MFLLKTSVDWGVKSLPLILSGDQRDQSDRYEVCHICAGFFGDILTYSRLTMLRNVNALPLRPLSLGPTHILRGSFHVPHIKRSQGEKWGGGQNRGKKNAYETTKPPDK